MSGERGLGFVDTNVLVYALDKSGSAKQRAAQGLLNKLMAEDRLRVSTQVLQELYVTVTRKALRRCSSEEALAVLEDLAAWPLVVVDYEAIRAAAGWPTRRSFRSGMHWSWWRRRGQAPRCCTPRI